jgi:hypothetical protein
MLTGQNINVPSRTIVKFYFTLYVGFRHYILLKEEVTQTDWTGVWPLAELGCGPATNSSVDSFTLNKSNTTHIPVNCCSTLLDDLYYCCK